MIKAELTILLSLLCTLPFQLFGQFSVNRFSVKTGISSCVQQRGVSLFDKIDGPQRGIQSALLTIGYEQPVYDRWSASIAFQYIEKGRYSTFTINNSRIYWKDITEHKLLYLEMPVYVRYNYKKSTFMLGGILSYLLDERYMTNSDYRVTNSRTGNTSYMQSGFSGEFYKRYNLLNHWDWGMGMGYAYRINKHLSLEVTVQKHFVKVLKNRSDNLVFNFCILGGLTYRF